MARFVNGTHHGMIAATEAAGNSATLSAITVIADIADEFKASGGTFEFAEDIYIIGAMIWGDVANLTQVTLQDSTFAGGRKIFDSRANQPAETATAQASGFLDFRHAPIKIPAGDAPELNFAEDASTNVEPHVNLWYCRHKPEVFAGPMYMAKHMLEPQSAVEISVAHSGTTAVTWVRGTNRLETNGESLSFPEEGKFLVTGHRVGAGPSCHGSLLEIAGLRPGASGPIVDGNVNQPWFDPLWWDPIECTGKELNKGAIITVDVDGSQTPTNIIQVRRIA